MITTYTTYGEVRASLGVSDEEVDDATLALGMYSEHLDMEMYDVEIEHSLPAALSSTFATITAIAINDRTAAQARALASIRLFSTYAVARHLGTSLAMLAPKAITDGKAALTRFSDSPYKATLLQVEGQYEKAKASLARAVLALGSLSTTSIITSFMGVASPAVDPVTGS